MNSRRVCVVVTLGLAICASPTPRTWAAVVTQDVVFATMNQSMWSPGQATANYKGSAFLGPEWGGRSYAVWGSVPTVSAFAAMHLHPGRVGLEASFQASTGGIDVDYPVRLDFTVPDKVKRGE